MKGTIRFDSNPENVEVYLNNENMGVTPLDIVDAFPGIYRYLMKKDEDNQFSSELQVYQRKITHIIVDFPRNTISKEYIDIESRVRDPTVTESPPLRVIREPTVTESPTQKENFTEEEQTAKEKPPTGKPSTEEPPTEEPPTEEPSIEKPPTEKPPTEEPPTGEPQDSVLSEHLSEMNKILSKNNEILVDLNKGITTINEHMMETSGYNLERKYFTTGETAIRVATPTKPETSDIIADPNTTPVTTGYDRINIYDVMLRRSPDIAVVNDGSTNLYIVISHDGKNFSASEVTLMRGEIKHFYNVYELRIRGPAAGNLDPDVGEQPGGLYRATEYPSRFDFFNVNKSAIAVATSAPVVAIGVGFTTFTIVGDIINLTSAFRARVTNTDNVYYTSAGQDITVDAQRGILAPGDVLIVSGTRGMQINFAGNSAGQAVEATSETDLA